MKFERIGAGAAFGDQRTELDASALNGRRFTPAQLAELFAAVLVDDEVDPEVPLPAVIALHHPVERLGTCFAFARALWRDGFEPETLARLTHRLMVAGDLPEADRLRFKHMRAKFKHLRYAHALYGADGRYPRLLDQVTILMGHIQDGWRNGRPVTVRSRAALLRLALAGPVLRRLLAESDRLRLVDQATFRDRLLADADTLAALLAEQQVTGPIFHAARKRIGRQVSFWDTLRTLEPTSDRFRMSRALSAVNGLMGNLHDEMVARKAADPATYAAPFALPDPIRERVAPLLSLYRAAA